MDGEEEEARKSLVTNLEGQRLEPGVRTPG